MQRPALYARISDDREGTGLGVARQIADCRALAAARQWPDPVEYVDNDISASSGVLRPAYRRLLDDITNRLVDGVIVWDLDRLHRRPIELEEFLDLADRHGVQLASVGGDVDLGTVQGRMFARIKGAVARAEAEQISRRVKRKLDERAEAGLPAPSGRRPYGFKPDRVTHEPAEVAVIRTAAVRVLAGDSLRSIAADLQAAGIPTVTGSRWFGETLRGILVHPRTAGYRVHRGQVIGDGAWEPILDRDTWQAIVALTDGRTRPPGHAARKHLLSGLLTCALCLRPMVSHISNRPRELYACRNDGCRGVARKMASVDAFITGAVIGRLRQPHMIARLTRVDDDPELATEIAATQARLEQVAIDFADDPDITPDLARAAARRLRSRLDELLARQERNHRGDVLRQVTPEMFADPNALTLARRRAVIVALFNAITVHPAGPVGRREFDPDLIDLDWR